MITKEANQHQERERETQRPEACARPTVRIPLFSVIAMELDRRAKESDDSR